jgi:hypothetical protein
MKAMDPNSYPRKRFSVSLAVSAKLVLREVAY